MVTESQFGTIVELVLEELSGIVLRDGELAASTSLPLRAEVDHAMSAIREPNVTRGHVLSASLGLVDEFVRSRLDEVVREVYVEYVKRQGRR